MQNASRELLDAEAAMCDDRHVAHTRFTVGRDSIAVGVNTENDWVDHLTLEELTRIWTFEATGTVTRWNDIRSEWPDERLHLHGRDSGSGTFDYFTTAIGDGRGDIRDDYSATSQTDEIWDAVAGNRYALGWGPLGHLRSLQDLGGTLRTVPVESDEEPGTTYEPTQEHVESGKYSPLSRPLYLFVNHDQLADRPDLIGSFLRFTFNGQLSFARAVGFFGTQPDGVATNHERLNGLLETLGVRDEVSVGIEQDGEYEIDT